MFDKMLERMKNDKGFIAALDQSGGSTPKALRNYGIGDDQYDTEENVWPRPWHENSCYQEPIFWQEVYPWSNSLEQTMDRTIDGELTGSYLLE